MKLVSAYRQLSNRGPSFVCDIKEIIEHREGDVQVVA